MPELRTIENGLWAVVSVVTALLAAKLFYTRLAGSYRVFTAFLVYSVFRSLVIPFLHLSRKGYGYFYVTTESLTLILYLFMVLETYALVFKEFPGLRRFSIWMLAGTLAISIALSGSTVFAGTAAGNPLAGLGAFFVVERGFLFALTLMILLITAFLIWFPVPLPKNVIIHSFLFAAFFLSKALVVLYRNLTRQNVRAEVSIVLFGLALVCLTAWLVFLTVEGEQRTAVSGTRRSAAEEEILLSRIRALNGAAEKIGRK